MQEGIYEELVTQLVRRKLEHLDKDKFYIQKVSIDKEEASALLARHLSTTIKNALNYVKGESGLKQFNLSSPYLTS